MPLFNAPVLLLRGSRSVGETAADGTVAPADTENITVVSWSEGNQQVLVATLTPEHKGRPGWVQVDPRTIYRGSPPIVAPPGLDLPDGAHAWRTPEYTIILTPVTPGVDVAWPELPEEAPAPVELDLGPVELDTEASSDAPPAPRPPQPRKKGKFASWSTGV